MRSEIQAPPGTRRSTDSPSVADAALQLPKDIFVAADAAGTGLQAFQYETALSIEVKNLLGLGHLEGIAANPVDQIVVAVHASSASPAFRSRLTRRAAVSGPHRAEGTGTKREINRLKEDPAAHRPSRVVAPFDPQPSPAPPTLIVVDRDEEPATRLHHVHDVAQCSPHVARMVKDTPGIHDIELPECGEHGAVEHRSLQHLPRLVLAGVATAQRSGTGDGGGVVIERHRRRTEPPGGDREEA